MENQKIKFYLAIDDGKVLRRHGKEWGFGRVPCFNSTVLQWSKKSTAQEKLDFWKEEYPQVQIKTMVVG